MISMNDRMIAEHIKRAAELKQDVEFILTSYFDSNYTYHVTCYQSVLIEESIYGGSVERGAIGNE